jgi:hypothetical protein
MHIFMYKEVKEAFYVCLLINPYTNHSLEKYKKILDKAK